MSADRAKSERSSERLKKQMKVSCKEFSSAELHIRFESHVSKAQDAFLKGDNALAEAEATLALRIRPTAHLFALLAVIAESQGQFDRASDFRLLQAFLARDVVLWEELLHDFLSQQLFFKSVVCLQRLSAMETDKVRYRQLQLQLADLLIGLGEIRRATNVLVPLWNSSRCRDFEVFALLSSLYFQLGKWSSLQALISSSLKHSFGAAPSVAVAAASEPEGKTSDDTSKRTRRVTKRVRFFGMPNEEEDTVADDPAAETADGWIPIALPTPAPTAVDEEDDFSFDDLGFGMGDKMPTAGSSPAGAHAQLSTTQIATGILPTSAEAQHASEAVRSLYGETVTLTTPAMKRNFMTLVNVHAELLNESGKFAETIRLMEYTAAVLQVTILDLPPDLLVRLGTAYAFQGDREQPCREVFEHLLETCAMDEYGDVLLDAAVSLQKVGMQAEARRVFETFARYHDFSHRRVVAALETAREALQLAEENERAIHERQAQQHAPLSESAHVASLRQRYDSLRAECDETATVLTAACVGVAQCSYATGDMDTAIAMGEKALALDPQHLHSRLLLGKIYYYEEENLEKAVQVLTPTEGEPALVRIQLGAALVRFFFRSAKYVEAIALGVAIFDIILSSAEDGDTASVAPGSSRRSTAALLMPAMSRASSAIVPAGALAETVGTAAASSLGGGSVAGSVNRLSASLAASIRSGTSVYRQQLQRRGRTALTTTVYGASAAASVAAGWGREEEEEKLKESSTIFRFNRKRTKRRDGPAMRVAAPTTDVATGASVGGARDGEADTDAFATEEGEAQRRKRQRIEEATTRDARTFWPTEEEGSRRAPHGAEATGSEALVKTEERNPPTAEASPTTDTAVPPPPRAMRVVDATPTKSGMRQIHLDEALGIQGYGNATTAGDRDRDLDELEAFENVMQEMAGEEVDPESLALPSLEELSKQFDDPDMARMFLRASTHEVAEDTRNATATVAGVDLDPAHDRVTAREAITAIGRTEFMTLVVRIVDSYSALGQFSEAKEFAFVALTHFSQKRTFRQMGKPLERPLRLALLRAAMAAGESEDAYRVGVRLLQEDTSEADRNAVIELMHGVLNRCEDRSSILYRSFVDGDCDVAHLVLLANRYMQTRSMVRVLNLYLAALQERPQDIFLNFMVGLSYLLCSHQKRTQDREWCVSAAVYYLSQYQTFLTALDLTRTGEAIYNAARCMQFLRLHYLCVPLYERVAYQLHVPSECSASVRRAAQLNLYFIYRWVSSNRPLALSMLRPAQMMVVNAEEGAVSKAM